MGREVRGEKGGEGGKGGELCSCKFSFKNLDI